MKTTLLLSLLLLVSTGLRAESAKAYQVTGPIVALTDNVITVQKGDEKWEIARTAATKVSGKLAVGSKVTVYYKMSADSVDVKDAPAEKKAEKAEKAAKKAKGKPYAALAVEDDRVAVLKSIEDGPFFQKVRGEMVVALYNQPGVWKALGYEGPSADQGGYIHRGFDDIDWLQS